MNKANLILGVSFGFFLVCALSMGNRAYLLLALIIALAWIFSFVSMRLAEKTVQVTNTLSGKKVNRGQKVSMDIAVSHRSFLPIAPITLYMHATSNTPASILQVSQSGRHRQHVTYHFTAEHVGAMFPGVEKYVVSDIFGFFRREFIPDFSGQELLVLPIPFTVAPLTFAPGDMGVETMKRAMEDPSSPSDFRSYQHGDPLKRIHWKMSARKNEIIIRQFEEPALPDALVLVDMSKPHLSSGIAQEALPYLQDAIVETAVSVVQCQIRQDNPVLLPLVGDRAMEYHGHMGLPVLLEELSRAQFNQSERFERILLMQMGELRKTGAVVIVTSRLNSDVVDLLARMKRMGPNVRVYYVTYRAEADRIAPLVARMQQLAIELNYVTPQGGWR